MSRGGYHGKAVVPELPDILVYIDSLNSRIVGGTLERVRVVSPFLVRTVTPAIGRAEGRTVRNVRRAGKRVAIELDGSLFLVLHLMIAGRLHWKPKGAAVPRKLGLAAFDFPRGTLLLTEAGSNKQASLHVVEGEDALARLDPGGIDVLRATPAEFAGRLRRASHTLTRALTDPRLFSGVGNAYSDEILHAARLSPLQLSGNLDDAEVARLHEGTVRVPGRRQSRDIPHRMSAM